MALTFVIVLTPSIGTAQEHTVHTLMAALQAKLAILGSPRAEGYDLYFGNMRARSHQMSGLLQDFVEEQHSSADVTLFVKLRNENRYTDVGSSGGSSLGWPGSSAIAKLDNGEGYYTTHTIPPDPRHHKPTKYQVGFEPIKDASGVIGAYEVTFFGEK